MITLGMLYFVLKVTGNTIQTGWFTESVLSELFVLFIIRTRQSFTQSRPGNYLVALSGLGLIITLILPNLPFAKGLGLTPLPLPVLGGMIGIVFFYILTADFLKIWFFHRFRDSF